METNSFITHKKLEELYAKDNDLFSLLFQKWDTGSVAVLENIAQILLKIKSNLSYENEEEKITNAFVYSIFKVINKMISYFSEHDSINDFLKRP